MFLKEIKFFLFFIIICPSCDESRVNKNTINQLSIESCVGLNCDNIYRMANDSLKLWVLNGLGMYAFETGKFEYQLDSLLCVNEERNRIVTCLLEKVVVKESNSDGIIFFYGEKINNNWYFFRGASIVIPRSMIKNHPVKQPLSYQQLHQIALKEIYNGYLKGNGEINEDWFIEHFENAGYGDFNNQQSSDWFLKGKRFKTRKEYFEFVHLEKVRNNWGGINKDSIKQIPSKNILP